MNEIEYALQQLWFGATRRSGRKEVLLLAPESVAVWDLRDTQWLQTLIPVESRWDGTAEMLIFGLVGLSFVHLVLFNEEFREIALLLLQLFFG